VHGQGKTLRGRRWYIEPGGVTPTGAGRLGDIVPTFGKSGAHVQYQDGAAIDSMYSCMIYKPWH
jgi:hypothetical protein